MENTRKSSDFRYSTKGSAGEMELDVAFCWIKLALPKNR